jgi:O-antigen ligase
MRRASGPMRCTRQTDERSFEKSFENRNVWKCAETEDVTRAWPIDSAKLDVLGAGLLFALVLVWQIPNVMALRKLMILALCVLYLPKGLGLIASRCRNVAVDTWTRRMVILYVALISWMLVVAIFISDQPLGSLRDIRGEWLTATLCLIVGLGAGRVLTNARTGRGHFGVSAAFWGLVAHAILQLCVALWILMQQGELPEHFAGISDHRANVTYTNAIALAILIAEAIAVMFGRARFLGLSWSSMLAVYTLLLLSTFASGSRNGVIVVLVLTFVGGASVLFIGQKLRHGRHFGPMVVGSLLLLIAVAWLGVAADPRWQRIAATIPVAWDVDSTNFWVNPYVPGAPPAADGGEIDISVYHRIALARVAWRYLKEHPLGTDATRDSFRTLLIQKYPNAVMAHSHNGYLDFGIATGFPGLLLWVSFVVAMAWYGFRRYRQTGSPYAAALVLLVVGYLLRGGLDSIFREHMLEQFLLFAGLLMGAPDVQSEERSHDLAHA